MLSLIVVDLGLSLQFHHINSLSSQDFLQNLFRESLLDLLLSTYTHALPKDHYSLFKSFGDLSLKVT